jgi:hypothetical protein
MLSHAKQWKYNEFWDDEVENVDYLTHCVTNDNTVIVSANLIVYLHCALRKVRIR